MEINDEIKGIFIAAVSIVLITFAIAACTVNQAREQTNIITACFESVESPIDCAWFDRSTTAGHR